MKIIIPMAGSGNRFIEKGYKEPKPLIKVGGKLIIEHILSMFSDEDDIIFICNDTHIKHTNMKDVLLTLKPNSKIISIPQHKLGPVHTVKYVYDLIDDDDEVMVCYCDNPYIWDRNDFITYVGKTDLDGCVLTHIGFHPHTLSDTKMAFLKISNDGLMEEIKEKECYTDDPMNEHASTGAYYFKKGSYIKHYFDKMVEDGLSYNGEYYVTLVYNLLVSDGLKVGYYDTKFATVMGTPEEVVNLEAWKTIIEHNQVKTEVDLINCYKYWKSYYDIS